MQTNYYAPTNLPEYTYKQLIQLTLDPYSVNIQQTQNYPHAIQHM